MRSIKILTICPEFFSSFLSSHVVKRAAEKGLSSVEIIDIRDFADGSYRAVDDSPFGGGRGLILRADPVRRAIAYARNGTENAVVIGLTPAGETYNQKIAHELAELDNLIFLCGHYEGMDARLSADCDRELSLGDYVLTGGELPAEVITDSVLRLLKGNLREGSVEQESFEEGLLEYPQYTQPADLNGEKVPEVLLSGNHGAIERYRLEEQIRVTLDRRPDLIEKLYDELAGKQRDGILLTEKEKYIFKNLTERKLRRQGTGNNNEC